MIDADGNKLASRTADGLGLAIGYYPVEWAAPTENLIFDASTRHHGPYASESAVHSQCEARRTLLLLEAQSATHVAAFAARQETLTNVVRHATATQAAIRASHDGDAVVVEIEDIGIGITEAQLNKTGKWGLVGTHAASATVKAPRGDRR